MYPQNRSSPSVHLAPLPAPPHLTIPSPGLSFHAGQQRCAWHLLSTHLILERQVIINPRRLSLSLCCKPGSCLPLASLFLSHRGWPQFLLLQSLHPAHPPPSCPFLDLSPWRCWDQTWVQPCRRRCPVHASRGITMLPTVGLGMASLVEVFLQTSSR